MKVKLIAYTPHPERTVALAARTCHDIKIPKLEDITEKGVKKILEIIMSSGHHSVMEHVNFTFAVEGVSRVLTHQLVRHRIASYSQQSQRHVDLKSFDFVTPKSVSEKKKAERIYEIIMKNLAEGYRRLEELGVPIEDARYVLPNATTTNIVVSMNARTLLIFFELRTCLRAQWEIRKMANLMLREVKKIAPILFENAGPPCKSKGICPDNDKTCKFYPNK